MTKTKIGLGIALIAIAIVAIHKTSSDGFGKKHIDNNLLLSNVEALTTPPDNGAHEPAWWDFFNNYIVEERIPVSTTECVGGSLSYKGVELRGSDCVNYSYVIYYHCYDGGNDDLCTSSGVHAYI